MRRDELQELHYIAHTDNLASILSGGILSHQRACGVGHISVAMEEIQERRARVVIPGGRKLHDYANLYINARNKMMYKLRRSNACDHLCVLRVSTGVLDIPGAIIADKNASSDYVAFRPARLGLRFIDRERVFAQYWNHDDPIERLRHGSEMCAEVLIPDTVPPEFIDGVYVPSVTVLNEVTQENDAIAVALNRYIFML